MNKQQILDIAERTEAIKALLLANMCQLPKWDDSWTIVLLAEVKAENGDTLAVAEATPSAYLALVDELGLRDAFDVIQGYVKAAMMEDD